MKLYVGNLSPEFNDTQLTDLIALYGKPDSVSVVMDRRTKQSRGFGFVELSNETEAKAAIAGLSGKEVGGRALVVDVAKEQK